MRLDHPDFTFEKQREARRRLEAPKLRRGKPSWKISGEDRKPPEGWRSECDSSGKLVLLEEMIPPSLAPDRHVGPHDRSKFEVLLHEGCLVAGHPAEAGTTVLCYNSTAGLLAGRGRIISEEKNAF